MSLKSLWERVVAKRRQVAVLAKLRRAAFETDAVDHIHIKEVVRTDGGVTPFGQHAPLCITEPLGVNVIKVHPYITSSPRLCRDCEAKLQQLRMMPKINLAVST